MPRLENERHELFAQAVAKGKTYRDAYVQAGYKPEAENAAESNSSRLISSDKVKTRIHELQERMANRVEVTAESLARELDSIINQARGVDQHGAAVSAIGLKAKLFGLLVDRNENKNMDVKVTIDRDLAKVL